jgi:hypothetical protein
MDGIATDVGGVGAQGWWGIRGRQFCPFDFAQDFAWGCAQALRLRSGQRGRRLRRWLVGILRLRSGQALKPCPFDLRKPGEGWLGWRSANPHLRSETGGTRPAYWHPSAALRTGSEVGRFRFEEALLGVLRLAFCEPTSQRRDVGHPAPGARVVLPLQFAGDDAVL